MLRDFPNRAVHPSFAAQSATRGVDSPIRGTELYSAAIQELPSSHGKIGGALFSLKIDISINKNMAHR